MQAEMLTIKISNRKIRHFQMRTKMNFKNLLKLEGQSLVEYSIIIAIVSLAIIGFLIAYGEELVNLYQTITSVW